MERAAGCGPGPPSMVLTGLLWSQPDPSIGRGGLPELRQSWIPRRWLSRVTSSLGLTSIPEHLEGQAFQGPQHVPTPVCPGIWGEDVAG